MNEGTLGFSLYRTKTLASGSKQLIPDKVHNEAWHKTEEYAARKYGSSYNDMKIYSKFTNHLVIYGIQSENIPDCNTPTLSY